MQLWFCIQYGRHRCEDCFVQDWRASLGNDLHRRHGGRNKFRTYRRFKHRFEWKPYLTYVKSPSLRTALCRFRISGHLLDIERGRYQRPKPKPTHQRYCPSCLQLGSKLVEDEVHFLMSCSAYTEEQRKLFDIAVAHIPSFQKNDPYGQFELLMCFNDIYIPVLHQLALFVHV